MKDFPYFSSKDEMLFGLENSFTFSVCLEVSTRTKFLRPSGAQVLDLHPFLFLQIF